MNKDKVFIEHILQEIGKIERTLNRISQQQFREDVDIQDATLRRIEIIGEAVKNISSDFKKKHRTIEWEKIAGMRDKLVHRYFGVNLDIVWDVVREKLPELKNQIKSLENFPQPEASCDVPIIPADIQSNQRRAENQRREFARGRARNGYFKA